VEFERIEIGDFLVIAEIHSGVDARALARSDRTMSAAEAALAAPYSGFGDVELFPSLADKAAMYAARVVNYHPLPDGNKRTGYDVMREFIDRNGGTFTHPPGGLMETAKMIEDLAAGRVEEGAFRVWVARRLQSPNQGPRPGEPAKAIVATTRRPPPGRSRGASPGR
jgi:death on curing protein